MTNISFQTALAEGLALFGPGFSGGPWVAGAFAHETLCILPGEAESGLFSQIAAFCADIPAGGFIGGYVGYEAAAALNPELGLPLAPDGLPVVHLEKFSARETVEGRLPTADPVTPSATIRPGAGVYLPKVEAVIAAVLEGEIFQANISRRLTALLEMEEGLAAQLFTAMMANGAADYAAFLPVPGGAVLSNSPELFFRVEGDHIAAEPVKGTAARFSDPEADRAAARALEASEKDRAENIMIADLLRNDLAKVCRDHTIREPAICALRTLPAVHHLYSRIEGQLRAECGAIEALAALFPCGSVTGAPKHRSMQIISRLEGEGRGPYCGSVVYIPDAGPCVFSVAIRTAALAIKGKEAKLDYRAGGGVTALSDPGAEYLETEAKAYGFEAMVK